MAENRNGNNAVYAASLKRVLPAGADDTRPAKWYVSFQTDSPFRIPGSYACFSAKSSVESAHFSNNVDDTHVRVNRCKVGSATQECFRLALACTGETAIRTTRLQRLPTRPMCSTADI